MAFSAKLTIYPVFLFGADLIWQPKRYDKNGGKVGIKILHGKNEKGSTILILLMMVLLMTVAGIASLKTSIFESQIVRNHSIAVQAFYSAESGLSTAAARLKDIAIDSSPEWRTFIGDQDICETLGFNPENLNHSLLARSQDSIFYNLVIKHKLDEEGNTLFWGDTDGDYLNEINTSIGDPIEIVRSRGEYQGGVAIVEAEMRHAPLFFLPNAALFVGGDLENSGVSGSAEGEYNKDCETENVYDIITTAMAAEGKTAIDYTGDTGEEAKLENNGKLYPIAMILERLAGKKIQRIESGNNQVFGSESDPSGIYFCDGDFKGNNISGYGILAVRGDLVTSGNITWKGLVIIGGNSIYNGGGSKQVYGATLINGNAIINGTVDFKYDCRVINDLFKLGSNYEIISWIQL